jgi:predicted Kef-type K+ transport protein
MVKAPARDPSDFCVATCMGFPTYQLLGPVAMWIAVFIVMPVIAALLICWFLMKIKCSPDRTLREVLVLIVIWIALSFSFDAITYVLVVPALSHASAHWTFFLDQSPWIRLSYTVLIISG